MSQDNQKTRIQLDLSSRQVERFNLMMEMCDMSTRKELVNNAFTFLEWAVKESLSGKKIVSIDEKTGDKTTVCLPAIESAYMNRLKYHSDR